MRRPPELRLLPRPVQLARGDAVFTWLARRLDKWIAAGSLVPNDPVLDVRQFAWTASLRERWRTIRGEAEALLDEHSRVASFHSVVLVDEGFTRSDIARRAPVTAAALAAVPGLESASISVLAPGAHLVSRRGPTKGLISCQLALAIPRDGDPRMRIDQRVIRWAEGETLVFDDSYVHELWNDGGTSRIVLLLRFRRPLRAESRWLGDLALRLSRRAVRSRP